MQRESNDTFYVYSTSASQAWLRDNNSEIKIPQLQAAEWKAKDVAQCVGHGLMLTLRVFLTLNPHASQHHVTIGGGNGGNMAGSIQGISDLINQHKGIVYSHPAGEGEFKGAVLSGSHLVQQAGKTVKDRDFLIPTKQENKGFWGTLWQTYMDQRPADAPPSEVFIVSKESPEQVAKHGLRTGYYSYNSETAFQMQHLLNSHQLRESNARIISEASTSSYWDRLQKELNEVSKLLNQSPPIEEIEVDELEEGDELESDEEISKEKEVEKENNPEANEVGKEEFDVQS